MSRSSYNVREFTLNPRKNTATGSKRALKWCRFYLRADGEDEPYVHPKVRDIVGEGIRSFDSVEALLECDDFTINKHLNGM